MKAGRRMASRLRSLALTLRDPSLQSMAEIELSLFDRDEGKFDDAISHLEAAERIVRSENDLAGLVAVHLQRARQEYNRGRTDIAERHSREALRNAELSGNRDARIAALNNLGETLPEGDEALRCLAEAEKLVSLRRC